MDNEIDPKSVPRKHLYIAIAAYDGRIECKTALALIFSTLMAKGIGWEVTVGIRSGMADVAQARNSLISEFLANQDCTDLIFIDHDVSWNAPDLIRLCLWPVDFVGGCYRGRGDPEIYPVQWLAPDDQLYTLDPSTMERRAGGLLRVNGLPAGFLRVTRKAMVRMIYWYADQKYHDAYYNRDSYSLFEFRVKDGQRWSEDMTFCERWRETGPESMVWLDPWIPLVHTGTKDFPGDLAKFLVGRPEEEKQRAVEPPRLPPMPEPLPLFERVAA